MNGRGARKKGAVGERELAGILSDKLGFVVKRKLGQEVCQSSQPRTWPGINQRYSGEVPSPR